MVKLTRVDHRLIHGQVAFTWTKFLNIDCILATGDRLIKDKLRVDMLRLAKPTNVKLVIKSIEDAANAINQGKTDKYNLMILLDGIDEAYKLFNLVPSLKELNLGGTKSEEGKKQISKAIYINEHEENLLNELKEKDVNIFIQMVPDEAVSIY